MWKSRAPYCLFLRSFEMGHRISKALISNKESELLDTHEPAGGRLLRLLSETPDQWISMSLAELGMDGSGAGYLILLGKEELEEAVHLPWGDSD